MDYAYSKLGISTRADRYSISGFTMNLASLHSDVDKTELGSKGLLGTLTSVRSLVCYAFNRNLGDIWLKATSDDTMPIPASLSTLPRLSRSQCPNRHFKQ